MITYAAQSDKKTDDQDRDVDRKKQVSMEGFLKKKMDYATKSRCDDAVLRYIVADGRPFEVAAGSDFKQLCADLTSGAYTPPHPTTLSRKLVDLRLTLEEKMANSLKKDCTQQSQLGVRCGVSHRLEKGASV